MRLVLVNLAQICAVAAHGAGSEQAIVGWCGQVGAGLCESRNRNEAWLGMDVVAREEIQAVELICRHEALNLIQYGKRIERAQLRLQSVGSEPDRMAVGFTGLRAAGLAEVAAHAAFAEGDKRLDVGA